MQDQQINRKRERKKKKEEKHLAMPLMDTSHNGRMPSLKRCKSVGLGNDDGRARWQ